MMCTKVNERSLRAFLDEEHKIVLARTRDKVFKCLYAYVYPSHRDSTYFIVEIDDTAKRYDDLSLAVQAYNSSTLL